MTLNNESTILFIGDSITDVGRSREDDSNLGNGYVNLINAQLRLMHPDKTFKLLNRGNSGDRIQDLRARWETDCVTLQPDFLTIFIGINDTWRRYDSNDPTSTASFEVDYRQNSRTGKNQNQCQHYSDGTLCSANPHQIDSRGVRTLIHAFKSFATWLLNSRPP